MHAAAGNDEGLPSKPSREWVVLLAGIELATY
jgi:hypothetical protein